MKLLQQLVEAKYTGNESKSLQEEIRKIFVMHGGEWRPGWSVAYKDLSPNGKMRVKFDHIRFHMELKEELKAALLRLPNATQVSVEKDQLHVWFSGDPGIGKKISEKAYKQRLGTVVKNLKSLLTASGKTKKRMINDLYNQL